MTTTTDQIPDRAAARAITMRLREQLPDAGAVLETSVSTDGTLPYVEVTLPIVFERAGDRRRDQATAAVIAAVFEVLRCEAVRSGATVIVRREPNRTPERARVRFDLYRPPLAEYEARYAVTGDTAALDESVRVGATGPHLVDLNLPKRADLLIRAHEWAIEQARWLGDVDAAAVLRDKMGELSEQRAQRYLDQLAAKAAERAAGRSARLRPDVAEVLALIDRYADAVERQCAARASDHGEQAGDQPSPQARAAADVYQQIEARLVQLAGGPS